jgi:hypothetical protein
MPKIIKTVIEPNGDVHTDFDGFVGDDCAIEEARLREELAALGLFVEPKHKQRKQTAQSQSSSAVRGLVR